LRAVETLRASDANISIAIFWDGGRYASLCSIDWRVVTEVSIGTTRKSRPLLDSVMLPTVCWLYSLSYDPFLFFKLRLL
jgi:hypothetical protein